MFTAKGKAAGACFATLTFRRLEDRVGQLQAQDIKNTTEPQTLWDADLKLPGFGLRARAGRSRSSSTTALTAASAGPRADAQANGPCQASGHLLERKHFIAHSCEPTPWSLRRGPRPAASAEH